MTAKRRHRPNSRHQAVAQKGHTEGPNPEKPGRMFKFRETFEFPDKDRRIFTSSMQQEDGAWKQIVKVEATRKK